MEVSEVTLDSEEELLLSGFNMLPIFMHPSLEITLSGDGEAIIIVAVIMKERATDSV